MVGSVRGRGHPTFQSNTVENATRAPFQGISQWGPSKKISYIVAKIPTNENLLGDTNRTRLGRIPIQAT
jgi:hypothetical protein